MRVPLKKQKEHGYIHNDGAADVRDIGCDANDCDISSSVLSDFRSLDFRMGIF